VTFVRQDWLWALLALPVLLGLEALAARRASRAAEKLAGRLDSVLLEQRLPGQRHWGVALRLLALGLLIVGAAGPEWGHELVRRSAVGSEVVLVIDVSASMDVRDVPPSRLEEARREAVAVLERLGGSRVAVVAFAGEAVRLCPLTIDRSAARLVLESLSTGTVAEPGTDLAKGLRTAARLLPPKRRNEQVIILWTDGEDLERNGRSAVDDLARAGLRVFAIGVGTQAGDVVPVLDDQGRAVDVKRDDAGGPVRSRLDQGLLETLARRTGGAYFSASRPGGELPRLLGSLGGLTREAKDVNAGERLVERAVPRFAWFGATAALLLALERIRRRRRTRLKDEAGPPATREDPRRRIARSAAAALLLGALLPLLARPARAQSDWAKGDRAFRRGEWAAAESLYARRAKHGNPPEVAVNLATARARAGKTDPANEGLQRAESAPGRAGQMASYNLGTLRAEKKDYDPALSALRHALERAPGDEDARYNYEWVLRQREKQKQSSSPQQPQPQPSQPNQGNPNQQPQPQPSQAPTNPQPTQQPPPPQMGRGLNRMQAEQLLGSLQELERLEQQRMRQVRVMRERRGRDW